MRISRYGLLGIAAGMAMTGLMLGSLSPAAATEKSVSYYPVDNYALGAGYIGDRACVLNETYIGVKNDHDGGTSVQRAGLAINLPLQAKTVDKVKMSEGAGLMNKIVTGDARAANDPFHGDKTSIGAIGTETGG